MNMHDTENKWCYCAETDINGHTTVTRGRMYCLGDLGYNDSWEHYWDARFIPVNIERGVTLYALSWAGDPDHEWRDEIEAVYHGDVWRCEVQSYYPHLSAQGNMTREWMDEDDVCEEWYGSDKAEAALPVMFPLAEFPAELFIQTSA